jgi:hypothetical protein
MAMVYVGEAKWLDLSKDEGSKTYTGYYLHSEETPNSKYRSIHHVFQNKEDGQFVNLMGATALNARIEDMKKNMKVRGLLMEITYLGMHKSKSGTEYKNYRVGYDLDDYLTGVEDAPLDSTAHVDAPAAESAPKSIPSQPAQRPAPVEAKPAPTFGEDDEDAPF